MTAPRRRGPRCAWWQTRHQVRGLIERHPPVVGLQRLDAMAGAAGLQLINGKVHS